MSSRPIRLLFVRASAGAPGSEQAGELPIELLRLATAIKLGTPHRVDVHDSDIEGVPVRTAAAVLRPQAAVVWTRPGLEDRALREAIALRHAGCSLVLVTGVPPIGSVELGVEFDGWVHPDDSRALAAVADALGARRSAHDVLRNPGGAPALPWGAVDRKLVDYARYHWIGDVEGRGPLSAVLIPPTAALAVSALRSDLAQCEGLGIRTLLLRAAPWDPPIPPQTWETLRSVLGEATGSHGPRLAAEMTPQAWMACGAAMAPLLAAVVLTPGPDQSEAGAYARRLGRPVGLRAAAGPRVAAPWFVRAASAWAAGRAPVG